MISSQLLAKPTVRTLKEQEKLVEYIYSLARNKKEKIEFVTTCWKYYNNEFDPKQFEYLTKVGEFELPARLRHVPLQRHFIDLLISQQARRPFAFSTYAVDEKSVDNRHYQTAKMIIEAVRIKTKQHVAENLTQKQQIEMQLQQLQQLVSQEPKNAEEANKINQIKQQLPAIEAQLKLVIEELENGVKLSEQEISELERKSTYSSHDMNEELAQFVMYKLRQVLNIEKKSTKNFRNQVVTGHQYYYVDYIEGHKYPIFEPLSPGKVTFPKIDSIDYIQDGPWAAIEDTISYEQFEIAYGEEFKKKYGEDKINELSIIYSQNTAQNATFASTPGYGAILVGQGDYNYDSNDTNAIKRCRLFYKVNQRVRIKKSNNNHVKGKYFRHYIDSEKFLIDQDNYKLSNGYYVNKKNPKESYKSDKTETYSSTKGDEIIVRNIAHVYEAVIINTDYSVNIARKKFIMRDDNNYSIAKLPIIGRTYSSIGEKAYSLIDATKDLQNLYNIVHYHQELMLALAGAKGNVIDRSQKPSTMNDEEWEYHTKMGHLYIETVGPDGRTLKNASFNQWPSFDNTLSPAIQYLSNIKNQIEESMGNMIGVPRPRQGQVVPTDQVGTFNQSVNQSSLITEIIYDDHDEIERLALTQLLNIACRYCFDMDTVLEIPLESMGLKTIMIPAKTFSESFFDIAIANNTREENNVKELKQLAIQQNAKNMLPFQHLLAIYQTNTLKELEKKVEYFTKKSEEIQQMAASGQIEQQKQADKEKIAFEQEYVMAAKKMDLQVRQMELELEKAKLDQSGAQFNAEMQMKQTELATKDQTERMSIESEREVESAYLVNQDKHSTIEEKLRAVEIELNTLQNMMQLKQQNDSEHKQRALDHKKMVTDANIAKGKAKEKIKD